MRSKPGIRRSGVAEQFPQYAVYPNIEKKAGHEAGMIRSKREQGTGDKESKHDMPTRNPPPSPPSPLPPLNPAGPTNPSRHRWETAQATRVEAGQTRQAGRGGRRGHGPEIGR